MMRRFAGILLFALVPALAAGQDGAAEQLFGDKAEVAGPVYKGVEVGCDLPDGQQMKNIGGTDGAGLCVWTSLTHAARWQNVACLADFQKYMAQFKGGGWPDRVKQEIPKLAKLKNSAVPDFLNYEGRDPAVLDLCLKTGRMASVTYGYGERYRQRIAHMVNLVYFDAQYACVLDNNFPGAKNLEWMSRSEFVRRWTMQGGSGWAVVLLDPPPPPVPVAFLQRRREGEPMLGGLLGLTAALTLGATQWGVGGCSPVGMSQRMMPTQFQAPPRPPAVKQLPARWQKVPNDAAGAYLLWGTRQYGRWDVPAQTYRACDPAWNVWGAKVKAPPKWAPPLPGWAKQAAGRKSPAATKNFGMDWKPARDAPERYTLYRGGAEVPVGKEGAFAAMWGAGDLQDDSGKGHVTVIGSKEACDRVKKDIDGDPHLSKVRERCQVHCYRPDEWAVSGFNLDRLKVKADPMVYVMAPGLTKAKVIYGQTGWRGAQDFIGGLRKSDPSFDPNPGPPPGPAPAPVPGPSPDPQEIPPWAWLAGAVGGLWLLTKLGKRG